jgi:hypothetical protein
VTETIARPIAGGEWHRVAERNERTLRFACVRWSVPVASVRFSSSGATSALSCSRCIDKEPPDSGREPVSGPRTSPAARVEYSPRVDGIIYAAPVDMSPEEWLDVAIAALDQYGVSPASQRRIRAAAELAGGAA